MGTSLSDEVAELIAFYENKASKPNWDKFPYVNTPIELLKRIYNTLKKLDSL